MICIASSTGVITRLNRSERPASTPSGIPTSSESATAASISASVSMLSSQSPSVAKRREGGEHAQRRAEAAEAEHDQRADAVVPTQVSFVEHVVSHATRWSRNVANPLKARKMCSGARRCGCREPRLEAVEVRAASAFHVSDAGHGYRLPAEVRDEHPADDARAEHEPAAPPGPCSTSRRELRASPSRSPAQSPSPAIAASTASRSTTPTTRVALDRETGGCSRRSSAPRRAPSSPRRAAGRRARSARRRA